MTVLEELALFSDMIPDRHLTPLDTLVPHLAKALAYNPGERDLIILNHDIEAQLPGGSTVRKSMEKFYYKSNFRHSIGLVWSLTEMLMDIPRWQEPSDMQQRLFPICF